MLSEKILRSISNGLVRTLILSILSKKPVSGYSLLKEVEQITGAAYHAGVLYPILYGMEDTGLISGEWTFKGRRRIKHYAITEKGLITLERLRSFIRNPVKEILGENGSIPA